MSQENLFELRKAKLSFEGQGLEEKEQKIVETFYLCLLKKGYNVAEASRLESNLEYLLRHKNLREDYFQKYSETIKYFLSLTN
ncbi:MAG: hypothetical protein ACOYT4_02195 [Nanoarchaeota archaeon]